MFNWSFIPPTVDDVPTVAERLTLDKKYVYEVEGAEVGTNIREGGYDLEVFLPAELFLSSEPELLIAEGTVFPMTVYIIDSMYGHTDLEFRDSTWFDGENGNKCTLVSTPAGVGSVSTEAPPKNAIEKTMEAQTESTA